MANALERVRNVRPNEAVMSQQSYERMDAIARKGRMLCDTYREPYQSIQHQAEGTLVILHEREVVLQKLAAVHNRLRKIFRKCLPRTRSLVGPWRANRANRAAGSSLKFADGSRALADTLTAYGNGSQHKRQKRL
jgi:hypothetical protein